ncbi:MAG: hypothetical protein A2X08_06925 [Bacteroidetes bacterium GWA2_32_17]|nr:MAG: hypothetical protein A2X08_06925 [Bacteroidetes bacterium GWA2_32_17]
MNFGIGDKIYRWLIHFGLNESLAVWLKIFIEILIVSTICIIINYIAKKIILSVITKIVKHSKNKWDDLLLEKKVFHKFSHLLPAIIIYYSSIYIFIGHPQVIHYVKSGVFIYLIVIAMLVINSFLNALNEIYLQLPSSKERSIKGFLQVVNIFNFLIGAILILSVLLNKNPGYFLTGIGAIAAILMLVFKDTLLGLVAGIQLSANDMVKIGDWISLPSKNADGTVIEISLHTVKIENWDKTISMLPSYSLVSESFINYRGIEDSKTRRIKRSINIDINSIKFLEESDIIKLKKIKLLEPYITEKTDELDKLNSKIDADLSAKTNGLRLTNIGTFRKYIELYLRENQNVRQDLTIIVRQLQPTETGIPIELYFYSKLYEWEPYEIFQADIFDHLLAVVSQFGLQVFQSPTGYDFQKHLK